MIEHIIFENGRWVCHDKMHKFSDTTWCRHISDFLRSGREDADVLGPNMRIEVPVFPASDIFAQVHIKEEFAVGGAALMEMRFTPEIGRERVIPLGFWNPGEGMISIRSVIIDYIRSKLAPGESFQGGPVKTSCPQPSHPLRYTNRINSSASNPAWRQRHLWNLVMEGACTPCVDESSGGPDNFGVDPDSVGSNQFGPRPF